MCKYWNYKKLAETCFSMDVNVNDCTSGIFVCGVCVNGFKHNVIYIWLDKTFKCIFYFLN